MSTIHPFIALVREGRYNLPQWYTMLPLGEIVEYVSYNFEWSPKDSIYKLILMFCLPEMQKRWETLRLRLLNTSDNGVRQLIFHYAQEGKIIHLAALLLIDPPHFDRSASLGKDHSIMHKLTTIEMARQLVATKMVSLIVEDQKLTGRSNKLIQKKRLMMSVLALLEICERIGVEMEYLVSGSHVIYTQSSNRAESMAELLVFMFKDSGFPVTNELEVFKHMNCKSFLDEPQGNVSGELWGFTFEKDPYYPLYNKFESPAVIDNNSAKRCTPWFKEIEELECNLGSSGGQSRHTPCERNQVYVLWCSHFVCHRGLTQGSVQSFAQILKLKQGKHSKSSGNMFQVLC
ncbi:uncharacterized protein LOC132276691 isoform X3 [Cornus florida]|uniref:uncharacterized protein LOC132276691 isoform X3 n=1 Tax=Cornus florida TaxID=4283 RepID=UPI00289FB562|nr:uncharacterized protein LOC132276691 isoform X3 [Cornus florida]XP_059634240.1 uncharacterized protein LOC132276691 isoform X3 [Cornus florida]